MRCKPVRRDSVRRVRYRGVFKPRADNKFGEFILPLKISNIKDIQAIERRFTRVVKAQKSTSMLIRWQIISILPTQTTQSISYKPSLHTFNLVYTHISQLCMESILLHTVGVLQLRTNQGRVERPQSVWISELD
jgi:hypothetical protein